MTGSLRALIHALAAPTTRPVVAVVVFALAIPGFVLYLAAGYDGALGHGVRLAYQRDIAALDASDDGSILYRRTEILHGADRTLTVVEIAGPPGARLDWPGLPVLPAANTVLVSKAATEEGQLGVLLDQLSNLETGSTDELPETLTVSPDEAVALLVLPTPAPEGFAPISPGFNMPERGDLRPPASYLLPSVFIVLLPTFSLVQAAGIYLIKRSEQRLGISRLLGVRQRDVKVAVAAVLGCCAVLGGGLGLLALVATQRLLPVVGDAYASRLSITPVTAIVVLLLLMLLVTTISLIATRRLGIDPLGARRSVPASDGSTHRQGLQLSAGAVLGGLVVRLFGDQMFDGLLAIVELAVLTAGAVGVAVLVLPAATVATRLLVGRSAAASYADASIRSARSRVGPILAPLAIASFASGFALTISATLDVPEPRADLSVLVKPGSEAGVLSEVREMEGVRSAELEDGSIVVVLDPPEEARAAVQRIRAVSDVVFVEFLRELASGERLQMDRAKRIIYAGATCALVVGSLAGVLSILAALAEQQARMEQARVFGLSRGGLGVIGAIAIWLPVLSAIAPALLLGVTLGLLVRDGSAAASVLDIPPTGTWTTAGVCLTVAFLWSSLSIARIGAKVPASYE